MSQRTPAPTISDRARTTCRICEGELEPFMSFGPMPIANGFLTEAETSDEYFFDLRPGFCSNCFMFQLVEQPPPELMFHDRYAFVSGTSSRMQEHFRRFAEDLRSTILSGRPDPFVVELGSNDGIFLRHFAERAIRHLGVEPSANVADMAREKGVQTVTDFFTPSLAETIREEHGRADCIVAANVMCHIADLPGVAAAAAHLLAPNGVFVFEDPYLGDMLSRTSYDQIYDEHVFIFSASSVSAAFREHGLELVDVQPQPTHGGSMRYTLAHQGARPVSDHVPALMDDEIRNGLRAPKTFESFRESCESSREALRSLLHRVRGSGDRMVGYAATSKSTTVINYCDITPRHLEYICDTTPAKQGKLSPGAHIPVRPHSEFTADYPDFAVLFAWNHAAEIEAKEQAFLEAGGRWITYVPDVGIRP